MSELHGLLRGAIDVAAVARYLDGLTHDARVEAARSITAKQQAALYDAARGARAVAVAHFVPAGVGPMREVIHWGRNSLPAFKLFQKRFCRPDDEEAAARGELWGFNRQAFELATGPGYFVAYDLPGGEVLIDYTRVPPRGAPGWPAVLPNSARLSRFVYNGTQDTMRGVSAHVTIGRASRGGRPMDNWFVLCREDPSAAAP